MGGEAGEKQRPCPLLPDGRRDLSDAGQVRFGLSKSSSVLCFERANKTPTVVVLKEEIDSNFMVMVDGDGGWCDGTSW